MIDNTKIQLFSYANIKNIAIKILTLLSPSTPGVGSKQNAAAVVVMVLLVFQILHTRSLAYCLSSPEPITIAHLEPSAQASLNSRPMTWYVVFGILSQRNKIYEIS